MQWFNVETPSFAGAGGSSPAIVERMELRDHQLNLVAWFNKDAAGAYTFGVEGFESGSLSKATGAEVDTGTDDAKFITPKALADSEYIKASQIVAEVADSAARLALTGLARGAVVYQIDNGFFYTLIDPDNPDDAASWLNVSSGTRALATSDFITPDDNGKILTYNNPDDPCNVEPSGAFPAGFSCDWVQVGAQTITFNGTILNPGNRVTSSGIRASGRIITPDGSNFYLSGDLV